MDDDKARILIRSLLDHPALEELDLTACRQLKDEAIVYLAQRRGASLRSLSLAVNANVGDTAVQELARNCPELQHLDLTGCLRVGSDGIRCLGLGSVRWEKSDRLSSLGVGAGSSWQNWGFWIFLLAWNCILNRKCLQEYLGQRSHS